MTMNNYLMSRISSENFVAKAQPLKFSSKNKLRIIYVGLHNDSYSSRRPSFEYRNLYLSMKNLSGAEVLEYPYDLIIGMRKKEFNKQLLDLIKKEKPDLFFAFMYTDELDPGVLDEIKKITKSVAWFADDYWRFFNYSRNWSQHFSWVVTTYSKAIDWYKKYGYNNVILSQWACNTAFYKPVDIQKDIDVSFVGQRRSGRVKVINALIDAGIDVNCFGFGWPDGKISEEEKIKVFSRSKINLNLTDRKSLFDPSVAARLFLKKSINRIVPDFHIMDNLLAYLHFPITHTHARPFELAGCRAFTISGRSEDIGRYYKEGKEMVFYDNSRDLAEKIRYFLMHDAERDAIAGAGYKRTLAEHTYEKRFAALFKQIGLNE